MFQGKPDEPLPSKLRSYKRHDPQDVLVGIGYLMAQEYAGRKLSQQASAHVEHLSWWNVRLPLARHHRCMGRLIATRVLRNMNRVWAAEDFLKTATTP